MQTHSNLLEQICVDLFKVYELQLQVVQVVPRCQRPDSLKMYYPVEVFSFFSFLSFILFIVPSLCTQGVQGVNSFNLLGGCKSYLMVACSNSARITALICITIWGAIGSLNFFINSILWHGRLENLAPYLWVLPCV